VEKRITLDSVLSKIRDIYNKNVKSEPVEDKKPVAKKRASRKTSTKRKAIMKSDTTKNN
jgi:hypothetical protein